MSEQVTNMKVLLINSVCGIRSTGRIVTGLAEQFRAQEHECRIAYGREEAAQEYRDISYPIGAKRNIYVNAAKARAMDNEGFNAKKETAQFLKWAEDYNPDLLWLHNLHGYYIHAGMLFDWIKSRPNMQVRWTLHDCWAFTGHCTHFSYVKCDQWKAGCQACVQKKEYPASLWRDACAKNYARKKQAFCGVKDMTLITPSQWLADLVKQSFLKDYPVQVIHNTIDTHAFQPTPSDFRKRYGLENKKLLLGVATSWSDRKGLQDFVKLSQMLGGEYQIVLMGLTQKQIKKMPKNILCLPRTNSKEELAQIYTAADLFLNLSREETFGLTTVEALSCGTPAVVYKGTACEEIAREYGAVAVDISLDAVAEAVEERFKL